MKSWLRDLPESAEVVMRQAHSGVVETVWGGDHGRRLFDARVGEATCHYDSGWIAERDRPLLAKGARFWLVAESVRLADGSTREWREIRFPARPFLRIAEHEINDWTLEWRGWFVECRRPDGSVVATHPERGLHVTQPAAFRAAVAHLREGGCQVDTEARR